MNSLTVLIIRNYLATSLLLLLSVLNVHAQFIWDLRQRLYEGGQTGHRFCLIT